MTHPTLRRPPLYSATPIFYQVRIIDDWWTSRYSWPYFHCAHAETAISDLSVNNSNIAIKFSNRYFLKYSNNSAIKRSLQCFVAVQSKTCHISIIGVCYLMTKHAAYHTFRSANGQFSPGLYLECSGWRM